jgi:hypothetical protein
MHCGSAAATARSLPKQPTHYRVPPTKHFVGCYPSSSSSSARFEKNVQQQLSALSLSFEHISFVAAADNQKWQQQQENPFLYPIQPQCMYDVVVLRNTFCPLSGSLSSGSFLRCNSTRRFEYNRPPPRNNSGEPACLPGCLLAIAAASSLDDVKFVEWPSSHFWPPPLLLHCVVAHKATSERALLGSRDGKKMKIRKKKRRRWIERASGRACRPMCVGSRSQAVLLDGALHLRHAARPNARTHARLTD